MTNNAASSVSSCSILARGALLKFPGDTPLRAPKLHPAKAEIEAGGTLLYTPDGTGHVSIFKIAGGKAVEAPVGVSSYLLPFLNPSGIAITN